MMHSETLKRQVLEALAASGAVQPVAQAYGISHGTVTSWARAAGLTLAPAAERIAAGGREGTRRLWGDWERRRAKAHQLRARGKTLEEIAIKLGYRSVSAVHYALASAPPTRPPSRRR